MITFLGIIALLVALIKTVWDGAYKKREQDIANYEGDRYNAPTSIMAFPLPIKTLYLYLSGIVMVLLTGVFFWADAGTAYAVQYPWGSDKMVKTQGLKTKFWGRVIPLSYETSVKDLILSEGEGLPESENGIYNRHSKQWEFSDAIKARIATSVVVGVSIDDEDKFLKMADRNRSEQKLIYGRVLPNIDAALKNTCKLMDAQDYISGKASDFDRYFRDQLENGMYLVEEYIEREEAPEVIGDTGIIRHVKPNKRSSKAKKYRIKRDRQGNIMRDKSSNTLTQYGIKIYQAQVTSIDWEKSFDTRLEKQKNEVALTQLEKQQAERQYYTAKKEIAAGEAAKAKERAKLEKEQIQKTIEAETEAKVAEQNVIAEKKKLEVAKLQAQSQKVKADAQYYENNKLVNAGLTPQDKIDAQVEMNRDKWEQISKLKLPSYYLSGGGSSRDANMLESILGMELLKNPNLK